MKKLSKRVLLTLAQRTRLGILVTVVTVVTVGGASPGFAQNLLRNPGFESAAVLAIGQAILPDDWVLVTTTPDTYSNDGSYGLLPSGFGNFTGVLAFEGIRWVAGWSSGNEQFGQTLTAPLIPLQTYRLTGQLHQAVRSDLNNPGGYRVLLALAGQTTGAELVTIGPTTTAAGTWEAFDVTFSAPADAASRPLLIFQPIGDPPGGSAYPGIDDLVLTGVAPSIPGMGHGAFFILAAGLLVAGLGAMIRSKEIAPEEGAR